MKKNNKGFSLVELIVVIAIMAILAAVAVVSFSVYIDHSKDASDDDYIANVLYRVKLFSMEYGINVEGIVIPPEVNDKDDIKLIIGHDENGTPIYLDPEDDPNVYEIYETVGDYTMQGDYQSDSFIQIGGGGSGNQGGNSGDNSDDNADHTHNWIQRGSTPATCVSKGTVTYDCDVNNCQATKTEEGKFFGDHPGADAVQAVDGFKVWKCPECNQIIIKSVNGNAVVPIK